LHDQQRLALCCFFARGLALRCLFARWLALRCLFARGLAHWNLAHSPSSARDIRFTASTVAAMTRPGMVHSHHEVAR
ncbi:MAG: hypothetical protein QOG96_312, partial [Pseudonocardiales bacterium]|nr:hypothetical protein [Pseudonocardiales bacterium]